MHAPAALHKSADDLRTPETRKQNKLCVVRYDISSSMLFNTSLGQLEIYMSGSRELEELCVSR